MLAGMRLLATDLDGTLVFHHAVGQADAEALLRWREAGNLLVLATGRSVRLVQHAVEVARASTSIGLDYDYAVCATGTTVIDAAGQVHRTRMLEADQVREVVRAIGDIAQAPVSVFASTLERDYVLDDPIGLLTQVHTQSAEIELISSGQSIVPVAVSRTGERNLAYGNGSGLDLRYFPTGSDLKPGDVLLTSGLDGTYPAGIPVATVSKVVRASGTPYYDTQLTPLAALRSSRFVLVLSSAPSSPR